MAWYNNSWDYRVKVTVQSSKVAENLTNYPVYVDLDDLPAAFFTNVKSDGGDIRVTTSDETTEVAREVVAINTGGTTGQLHFKAPSLSSTSNTDFYIYYGNSGASEPANDATYGRNNVWSDYGGVWHMEEDPSGTAPQMTDSTGNGNDGTSAGTMTSGDSIASKITNGLDFDGSDDYISVDNDATLNGSAITVQCWFQATSFAAVRNLVTKHDTTADQGFALVANTTPRLRLQASDNASGWPAVTVTGSNALSTGTDYMVHATIDGTSTDIYLNGSNDQTGAGISFSAATVAANFARDVNSGGNLLLGVLDEVRIRTAVLSANWITTEFNNQNAAGSFYAVGSQETIPAPVAAFSGTPVTGVASLAVTFTDSSTNATSWSWDFGDGNTSTTQNPTNTYVSPGRYTVSLTATNAGGSDDEVKTFYIKATGPTGGKGTRAIATRYPKTSGLVAAATKQEGRQSNLVPERGSMVRRRFQVGIQ